MRNNILPDVLRRDLRAVISGTAAGKASARRRAYYAGPGNKFWQSLRRVGLTPHVLKPQEFRELLGHGIGLTDLVKRVSGADRDLRRGHFDAEGFRKKILRVRPRAVAFNGKRAAEAFLGRPVRYGFQKERIGRAAIFVLPSTSGAASGFWDEAYWRKFAQFVGK